MHRCESWTIKKGWALKKGCFWTVVLEKTLESPLDSKVIKPVNPKGNQPWIFMRRTDAQAETPILWPSDVNSQLTGKDPDIGKEWRQKEKEVTEDEMVGWHHQLNGHEFEQTPGDSEWQGSLVCCSPQGCKEWDTTEQVNNHHSTHCMYPTNTSIKNMRIPKAFHRKLLVNVTVQMRDRVRRKEDI